jgi:hypothetical protein
MEAALKMKPATASGCENIGTLLLESIKGEIRRKLASTYHFLSSVMNAETIPLKGSLNELEETASK